MILVGLFEKWRANRARDAAMQVFGWDAKCAGCDRWMHSEDCGRLIASTEMHWHYLCDCEELTSFALWGPVPIRDDRFLVDFI